MKAAIYRDPVDQQVIAPSLRRRQPQRYLEIAVDDIELADLEGTSVAGADVISGMVAHNRRHGSLQVLLFIIAIHAPQMARRGIEGRTVFRLDFHAVVRAVVDTGSCKLLISTNCC
jgi:hypothetical protein